MKQKQTFYQIIDSRLRPLKVFLLSMVEPECWIIDKSAKSILDIGSGQGLPMEMIKMRMKVEKSVGVDLFDPYLKETKKKKIHDSYIKKDVRKIDFPDKSFDVVMALQVLEHLPKKDAWALLAKMEKIAKKQVMIATPIGEMYHPAVDNNHMQLHKCHFYPREFEKKGYKVTKVGIKSITGEFGVVHKIQNDFLRKLVYALNLFVTLATYIFQDKADYYFVASKKMS